MWDWDESGVVAPDLQVVALGLDQIYKMLRATVKFLVMLLVVVC
jgi:hypothetical protein